MIESSRHPELDCVVASLPDLLHFAGCVDIDGLSAQVYDSDVHTWVATHEDGIEVSTTAGAVGLPYPFTMREFRDVLEDVEADYLRRWGD